MADRDPVAVLRDYLSEVGTTEVEDIAIAELERRQGREARLEALVRELGRCPGCYGAGKRDVGHIDEKPKMRRCTDCSGTGLVEAARKELNDGK